ncbi:MAG: hypothetical protein GEU93_16750 [Propionibacteriales bacterium]|nr:hypothetical protein [Propionibacteriales bacterium]MPZ67446.1 hypothetical protein [Pseudonocardiaceae bacterium]
MGTKTRKSIPLTPEDISDVDLLRKQDAYREALQAVAGIELSAHPSEADAVHALVVAGRAVLKEQMMQTGYAAVAAGKTDEDEKITRAASRRKTRLAD